MELLTTIKINIYIYRYIIFNDKKNCKNKIKNIYDIIEMYSLITKQFCRNQLTIHYFYSLKCSLNISF